MIEWFKDIYILAYSDNGVEYVSFLTNNAKVAILSIILFIKIFKDK